MGPQRLEAALRMVVQIQNWLLFADDPRVLYDRIVQVLGETVGVSRVYIFEHHRGEKGQLLTSQRAEWCAPGVAPQRDNPLLQNFDYQAHGFDHWLEALQRGEILCGRVADFPPPERDCLARQDIVSILVVPLRVGDALYGFIGFDDCQQERPWDETEINLLASVGTALAQALRQWQLLQSARETEARYRALFAAASDGIVVSDAQTGRILEVNPQAERLLGYPRDDLVGRDQWACHPPAERAMAQREFFQWVQAGGTQPVPVRLQRRDGAIVLVEIAARLLTWQGRPLLQSILREKTDIQMVLEAVPLGMAVFQRRQLQAVNGALCQILGYSRVELLQLSASALVQLVHLHDRSRLRQAYRRWLRGGADQTPDELRVRHRDGAWLNLACYGQMLNVGGRRLLYLTVQDVTEKHRMAEALHQSLAQFQLTFERSPAGMSITDREGRFLRVNAALCQLLQRDVSTLLSQDCRNFIHPDDATRYAVANGRLLRDEVPQITLELRLQPQPQQTLHVLLSKVVIARDADGQPLLFLSQLVDVTERVLAQQSLRQSEMRLKLAAQAAGLLVWEWDLVSDVMEISRYTRDPGLYPPNEPQTVRLLGLTSLQSVHPEDLPQALLIRQQYQNGEMDQCEQRHRVLTPDGDYRWLQSISQLIRDADGRPLRVVGVSQDITDQMNLLQAMQTREERLRAVVADQTELIYRAKANGELVFVNPAFCRYAGRGEAELLHQPFTHPLHPDDQRQFLTRLQRLSPERPTFTLECRTTDPPERWYEWTIRSFFDDQGRLQEIQGIGRDVTEKKRIEAQLLHKALHDSLTGLPNRRLFLERLQQALVRYRQEGHPSFALVFLDLDRFKGVNDSFGHLQGDQLLITMTQRLQAAVRPEDTVARFGGDEFALLLVSLAAEQLDQRLQELQQVIAQPLTLAGQAVTVQASMGVVYSAPHYQTPEEMLRDADTAMYQAKSQGRARWVVFTPVGRHAPGAVDLEIKAALTAGQFQVYYQPVMTADGMVLGVEAFLRWHHPTRGVLLPETFLPDAEAMGLLGDLDWWVLTTTIAQMQQWPATWVLYVNLSPASINQRDFLNRLEELLGDSDFDPPRLQLELHEQSLRDDWDWLPAMQALGVGLSLDGFGQGHLGRIPALPVVKTLKIDRAFVQQLTVRSQAEQLVQAMVILARSLGMRTVAVGVETEQQARTLSALGCHALQGNFLSPPLTAEELTARFVP
ncbi:MAG: PAS domain S-box protein [Gloeomargarita sp. SKYBB_i_bin120]|nr:PAS domain S-box protein [Gloeomargarita sp. SKYG98]MCS7293507.1 PAS domain S-box protein [Gloeomargarita sp. SKYB120]MDW8179073.1 PAS domain S-box protein [Gloeomargarita sp. SKYBB_i_bin120]